MAIFVNFRAERKRDNGYGVGNIKNQRQMRLLFGLNPPSNGRVGEMKARFKKKILTEENHVTPLSPNTLHDRKKTADQIPIFPGWRWVKTPHLNENSKRIHTMNKNTQEAKKED